MGEALENLIVSLIIRFIGTICLWAAYNAIAYEFNLPSFAVWVPFCLIMGIHFGFKNLTFTKK